MSTRKEIVQFVGSRANSCKGQSLVELALTLPLVALLMMGVVNIGFILHAHTQVAAAAGVGARVAAAFKADATESVTQDDNDLARVTAVRNAIRESMSGLNIGSGSGWSEATDVQFSYSVYVPPAIPPPAVTPPSPYVARTRSNGGEVKVFVQYSQPVIFPIIPGFLAPKFLVSSSSLVRLP